MYELLLEAIRALPEEWINNDTRWAETDGRVVFVNPGLKPIIYEDGEFTVIKPITRQ